MKFAKILTAALVFVASAANAETLYHTGLIDEAFLAKFEAKKEHIDTIVLSDSLGGWFPTGVYVAKEIRRLGIKTVIPDGKYCNSACSTVFQGGVERTVGPNAFLVYHPPAMNKEAVEEYKERCIDRPWSEACKVRFKNLVVRNTKFMDEWIELMMVLGAGESFKVLATNQLRSEPWAERGNFTEFSAFMLSGTEAANIGVATKLKGN